MRQFDFEIKDYNEVLLLRGTMNLKLSRDILLPILLLIASETLADEKAPIQLAGDDLYFQYRPAHGVTPLGTKITYQPPKNAVGLCGFSIRGNHNSRANPRVEWDLNIDELMAGSTRVAGISAGTFDVVGHERKPRSPIVELNFSIEGEPQAISAQIVGSPNTDNAIKALLETEPANKLFIALSDPHWITISLKYADNTADLLQIRGGRFWRDVSGGQNTFFAKCLRGDTPDPLGPHRVN